ncbi:hypothetical protein COOONC_24914 [Cooperia oncophora]
MDKKVHYMKAALIPLVASIICAVAYGILINTIRRSSVHLRHRDTRMNIQVVGLLVALLCTCIHFCIQYTFNILEVSSFILRFLMVKTWAIAVEDQ